MPAYVIADISITDPNTYERYKGMAPASIAKYGGRYLVRGGTTSVLEGAWTPGRMVILEFKDAETARQWWSSTEYADAKKVRQSASRGNLVLLDGPPFDPGAST
jgi:uncharacterized protein (DUF1330 family)